MSAWSACCRRYTALFGDHIADTGAYLPTRSTPESVFCWNPSRALCVTRIFGVFLTARRQTVWSLHAYRCRYARRAALPRGWRYESVLRLPWGRSVPG